MGVCHGEVQSIKTPERRDKTAQPFTGQIIVPLLQQKDIEITVFLVQKKFC